MNYKELLRSYVDLQNRIKTAEEKCHAQQIKN